MTSRISSTRKRKAPDFFSPLSVQEEKQVIQVLRTSLRQLPDDLVDSDDEIAEDDSTKEDSEEENEQSDSDDETEQTMSTKSNGRKIHNQW